MNNRLKIREIINIAGNEFFENLYNLNEDLGNIAGEFMALNEGYVLDHYGEESTNKTVDILRSGFSTNQRRFLERLYNLMESDLKRRDVDQFVVSIMKKEGIL